MRILLASSSSGSRGGGELYLLYLGRALRARGHNVMLWASNHPRMDELCAQFQPIGPVVRSPYTNTYDYRLRSVTSFLNLSSAVRIAQEWRQLAPECIHLNKQNLEDGLDLLRAARQSGIPHLTTIHLTQTARYLGAQLAPLRDFVSKRALHKDNAPLVCVLEDRTKDLARFLGDDKRVHTIPNGVELYDLSQRTEIRDSKRTQLGIASGELLFVAVGRLVPQKRPFLFLDVAQRIRTQIPNAQFLWVGDGTLAAEWDEAVRGRKMELFVRRVGWQSSVRDFLFAADLFLHTAEFEGLPLAILEALSAGLPCAITPNLLSEMPFLNPGNSIAITDDDSWVPKLEVAETREMSVAARRLAEEQFSYDRMAARYETLYRSVSTGVCQ